jgi:hypothetical protein
MTCDEVGVLLAQGLELGPCDLVELARLDLIGQVRLERARTDGAETQRIAVFPLATRVARITARTRTSVGARRLAPEGLVAVRTAGWTAAALRPVALRTISVAAERRPRTTG